MPSHLPLDRPPYDVIAVFDSCGRQPSFAYTRGAFEAYGIPEVFVWAVPDSGIDPGEHWELSPCDLHVQANDAVERLRDGATEGASWDHGLDGGRTVLRTTLVEADEELPTHLLTSGTPARRLHLELIRPPIGKPSGLPPAAKRHVTARTQRWADLVSGETLPRVRTALAQPYGPCTAGVELLLRLAAGADEGFILCAASLECVSEGGTRSAFAELGALARTAGRAEWVARATDAVDAVLTPLLSLRMPADERDELDAHAGTAFRCAAAAWVVADLIDDELFRRATASVRAAFTRSAAPEDGEPAPPALAARAIGLADELEHGFAGPAEHDVTPEALRAIWLMAWTGRGQAVIEAASMAGAPGLLDDDRAWELLAAVLVLDVAPELAALLPPHHRAA